MNENICYYPWVGIDIGVQHDFRPCCKYSTVIANTLEDYLASDELAQLKQDFLDGKKPEGCSRCWKDEAVQVESKRQRDWKYIFDEVVPDLSKIKALSVPFGNICNLACRSCKSYASSRWLPEEQKLKEVFPETKSWPHNRYYAEENFLSNIKSISDDLILIEVPGGEPFVTGTETHLEYLDYLIEHNAKNITIHYTTNCTIMPDERFWERWSKFKKIDMQLSIDGTGKVYEYTRWPGNWSEVYDNIKTYQKKQKLYSNFQISISHTLSIFNVLYIDDFLKWCRDEQLPKPYVGMVFRPEYYSVSILDKKTKEYLSNKLVDPHAQQVLSYMTGEDNQYLLEKAFKYIITIDEHRNQKFSESLPEFYNVLKDTCSVLGKLP